MLLRFYRPLTGFREECFYVQCIRPPSSKEYELIRWLLADDFGTCADTTTLTGVVTEIGPRLSVETPFSSNAVSICNALELPVRRIEKSMRYADFVDFTIVLDPLTQELYPAPLDSFDVARTPDPVRTIPLLAEGKSALERTNRELGLGMSAADIDYYVVMFQRLGRDPTDVELFQIGNGNSEHSRHHFFRGIQVIDGIEMPDSLMDIVKAPWRVNPGNSLIAFFDNSGVMQGGPVRMLVPQKPGLPSHFEVKEVTLHPTLTAETHNHPTLISPFPGAETGAGGRIRDNRAVGRGALTHAGLAGYCVGALHIPNYQIPGESIGGEDTVQATPLEILLRGSDGVSDYGNKIGEPLIGGFTRSFAQIVNGARREFRKPVLFSGGFGRLQQEHLLKREPQQGMIIVRIGGPAYRIGVGGGSASSMMQGTNDAELDLKSVQRGDPEMENRVNRVIQACVELGTSNPIESIHDQGAGGPSNVLTELMEPAGGRVYIRKITVGDVTMSVLEIWVAEYQEGYGLLISKGRLPEFQAICRRERVNCEPCGEITGNGAVVVIDSKELETPVNLSLSDILANVPRQRFVSDRNQLLTWRALMIPDLPVSELARQVFALPQVGSKGFLVRKVDRSVTGLVARQQCCGPMQIPVADAAMTADGFFGVTGVATVIGEQPNKLLIDPVAGARMAVAEMLTNLASVRITKREDVKGRANWMWAAKLPHEGANLYDAAFAMSDLMIELGIAIDGGKDSLSMATKVGGIQVVSPGELVITGYAPVPDIRVHATPDLKVIDGRISSIGVIDLGQGKNRLGGSALAQACNQLGDVSPDIDDPDLLVRAFAAIQELHDEELILAYHDRSDGGALTTLTEMCLAGDRGIVAHLPARDTAVAELFAEESGMFFEFLYDNTHRVRAILARHNVELAPWTIVASTKWKNIKLFHGNDCIFDEELTTLRQWWEATSTELEKRQANPETVAEEVASFARGMPVYERTFFTEMTTSTVRRPQVAIIREEGTNGDREMAAACVAAGLDPCDITMSDVLAGRMTTLDHFEGLIFPGGFSYADVFGSAKGWAAPLLFNERVRALFERFYDREDTFVLGVCNGCQLMARLGLVPERGIPEAHQPRFLHNRSGRFESRFAAVKILPSPSIFLRGMEGSILGIHVAHGEGRLVFPDQELQRSVMEQKLVPLAYVDPDGEPTNAYPYNPNGSSDGWTALCSKDGRFLAMMPHPERCFLPWQWPSVPSWLQNRTAAPWLRMFQNARDWCLEH